MYAVATVATLFVGSDALYARTLKTMNVGFVRAFQHFSGVHIARTPPVELWDGSSPSSSSYSKEFKKIQEKCTAPQNVTRVSPKKRQDRGCGLAGAFTLFHARLSSDFGKQKRQFKIQATSLLVLRIVQVTGKKDCRF